MPGNETEYRYDVWQTGSLRSAASMVVEGILKEDTGKYPVWMQNLEARETEWKKQAVVRSPIYQRPAGDRSTETVDALGTKETHTYDKGAASWKTG